MSPQEHGLGAASEWIQRWTHLVPEAGRVLDLACGHGRHTRWFAARGHSVLAVDRSGAALQSLGDLVAAGGVQTMQADMEAEPWPLMQAHAPRQFDAVVVTHYLWRPLLPTIIASLAPGGVLLYETFADGNATVGKPSRPDFLLQTGELLRVCAGLRIVAFEDGFCSQPDRFLQRIAAVRESPSPSADGAPPVGPARYPLNRA
jgi:SAM-dependent methyltransferase